jgi:uncharacterized protein (TIGR02217 family)
MSFIEARLLDCVAYGTEGGPTWDTRRVGLKSGIVRRNPKHSRPIYRFSVIYQNLDESSHSAVIDAFNACMGGVSAFRIKDWSDFEAFNEVLPVLGTGAPQEVQLVKSYTFGSTSIARPIRKPVAATVTMTANGAPQAATIDPTTGIATFTAPSGHVLRWSGQFDVPVMFEDDALSFTMGNRSSQGLFLTANVSLVEDLSA